MRRKEWTDIALAMSACRAELVAAWPPRGGYVTTAGDVHDRKLIYHSRIDGFDKAARTLAKALREQSARFNEKMFLRLVGTKR